MISLLRSFGSVLLGILSVTLFSLGMDMLLRRLGVFPAFLQPMSPALFALAALYRTAFAIAGGWVTAKLAPSRATLHALIYGGIGAALAVYGTIISWEQGPEFGPKWYPIFLALTAVPCGWLGAKLAFRSQNQ
jgi:hypothetical protein